MRHEIFEYRQQARGPRNYVALGIVWILPLRSIFRGVAQADPDEKKAEGQDPSA